MATIRHPITEAIIDVPDESELGHYRAGGWQTLQEWNEQEARRIEREAAEAAEAAAKAAGTGKGGSKPANEETEK